MMHKLLRISALVAASHAALTVSLPAPARACSPISNDLQLIDELEEGLDRTPPGVPVIAGFEVYRSPESSGLGCSSTSCDGSGSISVAVQGPADERTSAQDMGYVIELMGEGVNERVGTEYAVLADEQGNLWLHFDDRDQDIDITVSVRARDLGGNLGEPAMVDITSRGSSGCSAGARSGSASLALVILALVVSLRRRRVALPG